MAITWFLLLGGLASAWAGDCATSVSVNEFRTVAKVLQECIARVTERTGSAPQLPGFVPDPSCQLTGFNLHFRSMEFKHEACRKMEEVECPESLSVSQFMQISSNLRDCVAMLYGRTGVEPSFPDFVPKPECPLNGFNFHGRIMEYHTSVCKDRLSRQACPGNPSVSDMFGSFQRLKECRQQVEAKRESSLIFPEFPADPECFSGLKAHKRLLILNIRYCRQQLT